MENKLPQGWEVKKLGEVCRFINGRAYKKDELLSKGKYPVLRVGNFFTNQNWYHSNLELNEDKYCNKGDLLYAWSASFGPRIWEGNKVIYHYHIWKLEPQYKQINKYFLYYFLESDVEKIKSEQGAGTTMVHVSKGSIEKRLLPIPPLPEQKRIVAILDEAFEAIDKVKANTRANLQNARELFQSYLQSVFENKGDDWEVKKLVNSVDSACSLSYGIVQPGEEVTGGLPIIRPTDLKTKYIDLTNLKRINPRIGDSYKRTLLDGTELLLCVRGTTGLVSLSTEDIKGANVTRGIVPIRFEPSSITQDFGYYILISGYVQEQIKLKTYGAALMQINIRDVKNIFVKFPTLPEQKRIVEKLDQLSEQTKRLEVIYQQKLDDLDELKQSILQKAFTGELSKTQRLAA